MRRRDKYFWFFGLWIAGVLALAAVTYGIKFVFGI